MPKFKPVIASVLLASIVAFVTPSYASFQECSTLRTCHSAHLKNNEIHTIVYSRFYKKSIFHCYMIGGKKPTMINILDSSTENVTVTFPTRHANVIAPIDIVNRTQENGVLRLTFSLSDSPLGFSSTSIWCYQGS